MKKTLITLILLITLCSAQEAWDLQFHQETGSVQMWYNGYWANICADFIADEASARVICKQFAHQLGATTGTLNSFERLDNCHKLPFVMDQQIQPDGEVKFQCKGYEEHLQECYQNDYELYYNQQSCSGQCLRVDCRFLYEQEPDGEEAQSEDYLPVYEHWDYEHGHSHGDVTISPVGNLQVWQDGEVDGEAGWTNVCSTYFTRADAHVACAQWSAQQGATGTLDYFQSHVGCTMDHSYVKGLGCGGSEKRLGDCINFSIGPGKCYPGDCVQLSCHTTYGHPEPDAVIEEPVVGLANAEQPEIVAIDEPVIVQQEVIEPVAQEPHPATDPLSTLTSLAQKKRLIKQEYKQNKKNKK